MTLRYAAPSEDDKELVKTFSDAAYSFSKATGSKKGVEGLLNLVALVLSLKAKVERLEEMPKIKYLGNWVEGQIYSAGDVVSLGGSAWICERATEDRPTTHSPYWKLMVKAGRDGKPR